MRNIPEASTIAPGDRPIRFAALGDSTTVGLGDPMPGGAWRGWAVLLAEAMGGSEEITLYNLAVSGARTADVADVQLAAALAVRPHLASVIVGVNDTLRDVFDISTIAETLAGTVAALRGGGTVVITARLPDPGRMLALPSALARPLARRVGAINAVADAVAARFDTVHIDFARHPAAYERQMWSVDRLHPSERGHRLLARCIAQALRDHGCPVPVLPDSLPGNPEPTAVAQISWMATRGTRWVLDRCTDVVPALLGLMALEWWDRLTGRFRVLDDHVGRDVAVALAELHASRLWITPEQGQCPMPATVGAGTVHGVLNR